MLAAVSWSYFLSGRIFHSFSLLLHPGFYPVHPGFPAAEESIHVIVCGSDYRQDFIWVVLSFNHRNRETGISQQVICLHTEKPLMVILSVTGKAHLIGLNAFIFVQSFYFRIHREGTDEKAVWSQDAVYLFQGFSEIIHVLQDMVRDNQIIGFVR